jgi:hypothetical protein
MSRIETIYSRPPAFLKFCNRENTCSFLEESFSLESLPNSLSIMIYPVCYFAGLKLKYSPSYS